MSPLRVGIVGFGVMGARHARVFAELGSAFEVIGAYDPRSDAIPSFLRHFMSEDALVDACDLVVVSSPIEAHRESASRALAKGRHVLVEKPIAATWREAWALVGRAAAADVRLFVGHSERFHAVTRALHEELRGAEISTMQFRRVASGAPRDAALREGRADALLNLAVHDIDLAAHLGSDRVALSSVVEDGSICSMELVGKRGWRAQIQAGRASDAPERTFTIETATTTYRGDLKTGTLRATDRSSGSERQIALATDEPLLAQASAIAAAIHGEKRHAAEGDDGARAVAIAEQALTRLSASRSTAEKL